MITLQISDTDPHENTTEWNFHIYGDILHLVFSNAFSKKKMFVFWIWISTYHNIRPQWVKVIKWNGFHGCKYIKRSCSWNFSYWGKHDWIKIFVEMLIGLVKKEACMCEIFVKVLISLVKKRHVSVTFLWLFMQQTLIKSFKTIACPV